MINLNTNNFNTTKELNSITLKPSEKLDLWHRRFGHFSIDNIKTKLLKIKIPVECPICSNSKLKNKPHKLSTNKSKRIFELLNMDLVGPVSKSLYGNCYFFTILDDYSIYG